MSNSMVPPDTLPPSPSISTPMKIPDQQPPNISASLTEAERLQKDRKGPMMALNQQLRRYSNGILL